MHIYRRNIFYYETDRMQVVHHSNYIRWMEEARGMPLSFPVPVWGDISGGDEADGGHPRQLQSVLPDL